MLKTGVGDEIWLVHQPDHARVAGYLAAHWGNQHGFARPGYYSPAPHPEQLRQEVVLAIAEHDNGWWEWEASPTIDPEDGLPRDLPDVAKDRVDAGLQRWRNGVPRLEDAHPYVALLISLHAYWLYVFAFKDLPDQDDAFRHPIFGRPANVNKLVANPDLTRAFLLEQQDHQRLYVERLRADSSWRVAVDEGQLLPHARLLQLLDALSLLLCFGGEGCETIADVPRGGWHDRVSMTWQPGADRTIVCDPYPFDTDPLDVFLPARILQGNSSPDGLPLLRLHSLPMTTIHFRLVSSKTLEAAP